MKHPVGAGVVCVGAVCCACAAQDALPTLTVTTDNTVIDRSCRVVVPEGTVLSDADGNGVLHIAGDGVVVEFAPEGPGLVGASEGARAWETLTGVGVRVEGRKNVTLRGVRAHFYKVAIHATDADGLVVEHADVSDGYAMRLRSTPAAEDGSDWLWPHGNDAGEWRERYGAGICVERSSGVEIRSCAARRRQNGIVLDRVNDSRVCDNDMSFLSGWGLAMWRSSGNVVSRNALDFCVRGYSHGVYNRGQDSAGVLLFEQCSNNVFRENSATHGGDGFFGFAGREALGETPGPEAFGVEGAGCNGNLLVGNDFSYAAAHGIELTFSFGNRFLANRLVGNAICGVWGGYSQDTLIAGNTIEANGEGAYGLERGGVNIEHGANNLIVDNTFRKNRCGVHLWWDNDAGLLESAWAKANHKGLTGNVIARNRFEGDEVAVHLRAAGTTSVAGNTFEGVGESVRAEGGSEVVERDPGQGAGATPEYGAIGERAAVGARAGLGGREAIVMGEYFPWDHASPMVRLRAAGGDRHVYEVWGEVPDFAFVVNAEKINVQWTERPKDGGPAVIELVAPPGVHPYTLRLNGQRLSEVRSGTIVAAKWSATFFEWTVDPRENLEGWRAEASQASARRVELDRLGMAYGHGGPRDMGVSEALTQAGPGPDRFGMIATARVPLPAGRWKVSTLSDDGVRVIVDGARVIENWTWHAPTRDEGVFEVAEAGTATLTVEHFEIDGYAVLELELAPAE